MKQPGRLLGAIFIIAGTTIGASMLALPITSAHLGVVTSTILLVSMWALMSYTALVTLEVNLHFGYGINVSTAADKVLGPLARTISSFAIMILFYALLAAYISGGSSIIQAALQRNFEFNIPTPLVQILFTILLGFVVYSHTQTVDYLNRFLFITKLILFVFIILILLPIVSKENLNSVASHFGPFWLAVPIFFTSFGFHGSIPPIVDYIGNDSKKLRIVFLIGSALPLALYLLWQITTTGALPLFGKYSFENVFNAGNNVGTFINQLNGSIGSNTLSWISNLFIALAIATSFLGVGIGLFDFFVQKRKLTHSKKGHLKSAFLTFSVPLAFALLYPQGFISALGYAAIALSIIAVIIPTMIAIKLRRKASTTYRVTGGLTGLYIAMTAGLAIIAIQLSTLSL